MYDESELKFFDRNNVKRPAHFPSDLEDSKDKPLHTQLPKLRTSNWRREGNYLVADTEFGPFSQTFNPDYICVGTDDSGMPLLRKAISD